jgi:hypothetical protein
MSTRWLKMVFLAIPMIVAGYSFGRICQRMSVAYPLLLAPSRELLTLLLWLLLALAFIAVSAGVVAALLRPVWVAFVAFALSGLALLLGWEVTLRSAILALFYMLTGAAYAVGTEGELKQRIKFSVRPVTDGQSILIIVLLIVAIGGFYFGSAEHIKRKGFSIPEQYMTKFTGEMAKGIAVQLPAGRREKIQSEIRKQSQRVLDDLLARWVKPFEQYVPLIVALSLFMPLLTITRLLTWVPMLILGGVFPLLAAIGLTRVATGTVEVERLVIN